MFLFALYENLFEAVNLFVTKATSTAFPIVFDLSFSAFQVASSIVSRFPLPAPSKAENLDQLVFAL